MANPKTELIDALSRNMADSGNIVGVGWLAFRHACIPANVGPAQAADMRLAFYAGAQHLFATLMSVLDSDDEPTDADLDRMTKIHNELSAFAAEFMAANPGIKNATEGKPNGENVN